MRRVLFARKLLLGVITAGALGAVLAPAASAHVGTITIGCRAVTFSYVNFIAGETNQITEKVTVNGQTTSKTFTFTTSSATDTIPISGRNGDVVSATATWTVGGGGSASAGPQTLSGCAPPPCPTGTTVHFRWHYSANGSSGSWSATKSTTCPGSISIGPQAMEGDLKVSPGATVKVGYDFTIPGNNTALTLTVNNPKVVFTVHCVSGTILHPTWTVFMPTQTYSVGPNSNWYPSGNQSSSLVYQGMATVPTNLCSSGQVRLDAGGTFSASVS